MRVSFGSVCSGIEAASVAWHPLGWETAWLAEVDKAPAAVLRYHYPQTFNFGDMTSIAPLVRAGVVPPPEVLVGGTPCQAFSVAGLRNSLSDKRGQLSLAFVDLANAIDERRTDGSVIVWENVPGVLSTKDNAFGCFLAALAGEDEALIPSGPRWPNAGCVYGPARTVAWRVLDAQYFGVAQRRRRVFVVASSREGFDPAAVLFESEGMRRDTAPSRSTGSAVAGTLASRTTGGGFPGTDEACSGYVQPVVFGGNNTTGPIDVSPARNACASASGRMDFETEAFVVHGTQDPCVGDIAFALGRNSGQENVVAFAENSRSEVRLEGGDGQIIGTLSTGGGKPGQGQPVVCITGDITHTLKAEGFDASEDGTGRGQPIVAAQRGIGDYGAGLPCRRANGGDAAGGSEGLIAGSAVRRLTPRECERLQGFPDDYTLVPHRGKPLADGPRYKALGNSMAVPCMAWIGRRIDAALRRAHNAPK